MCHNARFASRHIQSHPLAFKSLFHKAQESLHCWSEICSLLCSPWDRQIIRPADGIKTDAQISEDVGVGLI